MFSSNVLTFIAAASHIGNVSLQVIASLRCIVPYSVVVAHLFPGNPDVAVQGSCLR